jgi:hypothetical protein
MAETSPAELIEAAIHTIRGQRVMLDADLAGFYGVPAKRLLEQMRRNADRFPGDFAFQLTRKELTDLRSQFATTSLHGGSRYLPWAFTEHGAIMLASVLSSPRAVAASVRVVRAFVRLRQMISTHGDLVAKLVEIERRLDGHDSDLTTLLEALRQLVEQPAPPERPPIDFFVKEDPAPYRVSRKKSASR